MKLQRDIIIFKKEGSYSCFPVLEQLADGRLMVALTQREFPSHNSKGRLRLFLAAADGEHWQETTDSSLAPMWPGATGKFRCQLNGDMWLDIGAGGRGGHFDAPEVRPLSERLQWEAQRYITHDHEKDSNAFYLAGKELHVGSSLDGGISWQRQAISAPPEMLSLNGFRGLCLQDNTLLFPVGGQVDKPGLDLHTMEGATWQQYMARSTDNGDTWDWVPMLTDPHGFCTEEVSILELGEGRILAMTRAHRPGPTGYLWQQWSADNGLSWSEPVETQVWGYPAHLLLLRDGRILCSYGYRFKPAGIRAVVSNDGGRSWDVANEHILRDDGGTAAQGWGSAHDEVVKERGVSGSDLGYPFSVELAEGAILTVYYFTGRDRITHVVATKWWLEDNEV